MNINLIIAFSVLISLFLVFKILGLSFFNKNIIAEYNRNIKIDKENENKILLLDKELKTDSEIIFILN